MTKNNSNSLRGSQSMLSLRGSRSTDPDPAQVQDTDRMGLIDGFNPREYAPALPIRLTTATAPGEEDRTAKEVEETENNNNSLWNMYTAIEEMQGRDAEPNRTPTWSRPLSFAAREEARVKSTFGDNAGVDEKDIVGRQPLIYHRANGTVTSDADLSFLNNGRGGIEGENVERAYDDALPTPMAKRLQMATGPVVYKSVMPPTSFAPRVQTTTEPLVYKRANGEILRLPGISSSNTGLGSVEGNDKEVKDASNDGEYDAALPTPVAARLQTTTKPLIYKRANGQILGPRFTGSWDAVEGMDDKQNKVFNAPEYNAALPIPLALRLQTTTTTEQARVKAACGMSANVNSRHSRVKPPPLVSYSGNGTMLKREDPDWMWDVEAGAGAVEKKGKDMGLLSGDLEGGVEGDEQKQMDTTQKDPPPFGNHPWILTENELGNYKSELKKRAERAVGELSPRIEAPRYSMNSEHLNRPSVFSDKRSIEAFEKLQQKLKDQVRHAREANKGLGEGIRRVQESYARVSNDPIKGSLFEKYKEDMEELQKPRRSLITKGLIKEEHTLKSPEAYTQPFCDFLTQNPTVWHAVEYFEKKLTRAGFEKLSERKSWTEQLKAGGKYFVSRNGSSLIAFTIGGGYKSGNGVAMIAGHVDALTARLKPVSNKKNSAGYVQLGVAPYAGALNSTWWDRDLGIGGRVLVKDASGRVTSKLVKLDWPIARIPTLAPHFGQGMTGQENKETQAVPIIGLDNSDINAASDEFKNYTLGPAGSFTATQPPKLVRAIAGELGIEDYSDMVNWELELFDVQPATTGGLDKEFIFAGRIDDKLCSWSAMEGLLASASDPVSKDDGIIKLVGVFDDEEIGSLLRQGARGNFLPSTIERITETFSKSGSSSNILSQTYANSFLISADVTHAVNPNFLGSYLENHSPRLNVGLVVSADSNGHMTTDSVSTALLTAIAEKSDSRLQLFMIRNDSRSGGTVGPMLSSAMGVRAIDAGIPQLSMHSIRATTGSLDPGLGVKIFKGFFDHFERVDKDFE